MIQKHLPTTSLAEELRGELDAARNELSIPGAVVGLLIDGQPVTVAAGVANSQRPAPVSASTPFAIASLTKLFTTTALMRLVETGRCDLDTLARDVLPELRLPENREELVTLHDLITHQTGWDGDVYEDHGRGDDALARVVARVRDLEPIVPLRRFVVYNNTNYYILGRILETLTRMPYERAVEALVLEPLGLRESGFFLERLITRGVAVGHMTTPAGVVPALPFMSNRSFNPTGGLLSSVDDLLRFARAHLEATLLSPQTTLAMREPQARSVVEPTAHVCLTWWVDTSREADTFNHAGDVFTTQSLITIVPERNFAFVSLANNNRGAELNWKLREWCYENVLGFAPFQRATTVDTPEGILAGYEGVYTTRAHHHQIRAVDDRLVGTYTMQSGTWPAFEPSEPPLDPVTLAPLGGDRFIVEGGPADGLLVAFCRDDDGRVTWFHCFGRAAKRR